VLAQPPQDLETVQSRQHDVEHHQVDSRLGGSFQPAMAFVLEFHLVAFAPQEFAQQGAELGVVIHQ